jgi:hypothetical protein
MIHTRSICTYTAVILSLWGCSGGDGNPAPLVEDSITTSLHEAVDAAGQDEDGGTAAAPPPEAPTDDACSDEGATGSCMAPIGARAGFVLCVQGARTCSGGHWTACVTHATSGPISGWELASIGCNAAPEPCSNDGEARACVKQLPPTPESNNCYHGFQTCTGNEWGPCIP